MRPCAHNNKLVLRLLSGWCGLLLYLGALSPIGMGVGTLLGMMDPDHHAILQPGADGMRLVLRHQGICVAHHHGPVARALTMFTQPASAVDPDHVLQFSSPGSLAQESQPAIATPNQSGASTIYHFTLESPVAVSPVQLIFQFHPPPDNIGQFHCLLSTVLLI